MKATFDPNGVLFSLGAEEWNEVKNTGPDLPWGDLYEAFEDLCCNGWSFVAPEDIGALTDAPILSPCFFPGDADDQPEPHACGIQCGFFWYPGYQTRDPLEDLRDSGKVYFRRASE